MKSGLPYTPALDGLRGYSVLVVMIFHAMPGLLSGGFLGVDIFFVLSGYLITRILLLEYASTQRIDYLQFFIRRWFRLGPALLALLLTYSLTLFLFSRTASIATQGLDVLLALTYLTNWARAFELKDSVDLGHTWSLAVEAQFYVVWPFLLGLMLRFLPQRKWLVLSLIGVIAVLSWFVRQHLLGNGMSVVRIYNGLDTRLETLMWGAGLGLWLSPVSNKAGGGSITSRLDSKHQLPVCLGWMAAFIMLGLFVCAEWTSALYYQVGTSLVGVLSAVLILNLEPNQSNALSRLFSFRLMTWLGRISYGLYLWHFPIYRLLLSFDTSGATLLVIGFLITIPVAAFSYYSLEKPLQNWYKNSALI